MYQKFCLCYLCLCFNYSFYADFGPLNLALLYRYCCKLNKKLKVCRSRSPLILKHKNCTREETCTSLFVVHIQHIVDHVTCILIAFNKAIMP